MANVDAFRLIAEALPEPTLLVSDRGLVLAVNRATTSALPQLAEGVSLSSLAVDEGGSLADFLRACARSRHFVPGSLEFRGDAGAYRVDGARVDATSDSETLLLRLTSKRRGSDQVAVLNQRVAALQEEIGRRRDSEDRERQRRASAEAANRATDRFIKMLSHELRTPLTAIVGWAHMLRMLQRDPEQVTRAIDAIERNARLQVKLLDDLGQATKAGAEVPRLDLQPIYLTQLVTAAVHTVRPAAAERGVALLVDAGAHGGTVLGDAERLQQIITNVLVSALQVGYAKGQLTVSLSRDDVRAEIEVTYKGPPETFIGDDAPLERSYELDTMVALTIARQLAELHGGSLDHVLAGTSNGFSITLRLPLLPIGIEDPRVPSASVETGLECAGLRVLVVDDEREARALLAEVLTHHGANVDVAENTLLAMTALSKAKYDVLVSDIAMPVEDGFILLELVRKEAGPNRAVPAVAVTAHASVDIRDRAAAAGFAAYVTKPVTPLALVNVIATVGRAAPN